MKYLVLTLSILISFFFFTQHTYSAIDFTLTPIKYELELAPWESITLPASIRNNGTGSVTLPTAASDFQSNWVGWTPSLVRKSELVFPDQELSTWITISSPSVTIPAWEEGSVTFTINVPVTATPGGHYWAVLFKNAGSEWSTSGDIKINVDYGILILVNVSGDVIVDVGIWDPSISWGGTGRNRWDDSASWTWWTNTEEENAEPEDEWWYIGTNPEWEEIYEYPDSCPLWDFTASKYDGSCFITPNSEDNTDTVDSNEPPLFNDEFEVLFQFPINNNWNTHIKPNGKVILKDENWNIIKAIWKEIIANEQGAIIWEKIVDYIPINDQWGNVLPKTQRVFESEWKGFPYKVFDDQGNPIVKYWSPSEYYTQKNKDDAGFLMFWERVSENRTYKKITAEIEMVYYDEQGNPIEFSTAKEFPVQYIQQEVTLNPYVILALLLLWSGLIFTYFGTRWLIAAKPRPCWSCDEKIKSHWKTCPHCEAIQNKRAHKAFEKNKKDKISAKKAPTKKTTIKKKTSKK